MRLDPDARTVRFARPGMLIDLGSAGKGYAVDAAIGRLLESGVPCAPLHGAPPQTGGLRLARSHRLVTPR